MKHSVLYKMKNILLINPPVYDFSAYDLWAKPLALLYLSSILKKQNIHVQFFDYMDRLSDLIENTESDEYGCGHYIKEECPKPKIIDNIKRNYYRFGIPKNIAEKYLDTADKPDVIIIGSIMTYWYFGVVEAAASLKKIFPDVPIILGGVYATLCQEHAQNIPYINDVVSGGFYSLGPVLNKYGIEIGNVNSDFSNFPIPDYSFYKRLEYAALRTNIGCPFNCSYCAQKILNNKQHSFKSPYVIKDEIYELVNSKKINNIVFYDDALLYNANKHIKILFKEILNDNKGFNFHTPNGLHAKFLDEELAELMFHVKLINPRFSLETADPYEQRYSDHKITSEEFKASIKILRQAGYKNGEYTVYLLVGMHNQNISNIKDSIKFAHDLGARISLSEYSPIPYTASWAFIDDSLKNDPLCQNNTYFMSTNKNYDELLKLKQFAKNLNNKL